MQQQRSDNTNPRERTPQSATEAETVENIASIARVPASTLAVSHPARTLLTAAASLGLNCYAYASGGERTGTWCAWVLNSRFALDNEPDRRMATAYALLAITRAVNDTFEADPNPDSTTDKDTGKDGEKEGQPQ